MARSKEFSEYQRRRISNFLTRYGEYYLVEEKGDIEVWSPKKVTHIRREGKFKQIARYVFRL